MRSRIKIFNKDCMEGMKETPDKKYDLAIVDPPYGIGQVWSKSRKDRFYKNSNEYTNKDKPKREYFDELMRVSKNQIIWGWNYFCHLLPESNNIIVWDKERDFLITKMSEAELAWTSFSNPCRIVKLEWNGFMRCEKISKKIHPFQKPVLLYKWLLLNYAKDGDKILDTHIGSGSIALACWDLKFDLIGYEINKEFFKSATTRLTNHMKQNQLF